MGMTKDSIADFVHAWNKWDKGKGDGDTDWVPRFRDAGYYKIELGRESVKHWPLIHAWCQEQFGSDHYVWTGSTFWFETDRDAMLFALKWS